MYYDMGEWYAAAEEENKPDAVVLSTGAMDKVKEEMGSEFHGNLYPFDFTVDPENCLVYVQLADWESDERYSVTLRATRVERVMMELELDRSAPPWECVVTAAGVLSCQSELGWAKEVEQSKPVTRQVSFACQYGEEFE